MNYQNSNRHQLQLLILMFITFAINSSLGGEAITQEVRPNFISANLLKAGTKAPLFTLRSSTKLTISLNKYKGKVILLDWWYIGCSPCIKAHKDLMLLKQQYGDSLVILGMNPINRHGQINRFKRKHNYTDTVLMATKEVKKAYKIRAFPTIYLINKEGYISYSTAGYYQNLRGELQSAIQKAL